MIKLFKVGAVVAAFCLAATGIAFAGPTYDRVMADKVVKAGISNKGKPFGFINADNEWVGFDMDMAQEIAKKIGEEAIEVILASTSQGRERIVEETADLIYHTLVLLVANDIAWDDVLTELEGRRR